MQFTTISAAACLVALTSASNHGHHFHMRRQLNATVPSTTLTVYATETKTILSCAAIVTDCPNRPDQATSEVIVTITKAISTTICPVADASSISSIIASGGTPAAPVAPITTGSGPIVTSAPESVPTDTVLTYTLGTGTSTTVVTTTIKHTETKTVYATPTPASDSEDSEETSEEAELTGKPGGFFETSPSSTGDQSGEGAEPTTTLSSTSTHTKYITVFPAPTGGSNVAGSAGCEAVAPVTVTVALSTVTVATTVTETAAATCPTVEEPVEAAAATSTQDGIVASPLPTEEASDAVVPVTQTLIPVPVSTGAPYGNGTVPTSAPYSSGAAAPTAALPTGGYEYK